MHSEKRKIIVSWNSFIQQSLRAHPLPGTSSPQDIVRKQMVNSVPPAQNLSLIGKINGSHANISKCCQEKKAWWGGQSEDADQMGWSKAATPRKWHGDLEEEEWVKPRSRQRADDVEMSLDYWTGKKAGRRAVAESRRQVRAVGGLQAIGPWGCSLWAPSISPKPRGILCRGGAWLNASVYKITLKNGLGIGLSEDWGNCPGQRKHWFGWAMEVVFREVTRKEWKENSTICELLRRLWIIRI